MTEQETMRAVVFDGVGKVSVVRRPVPRIQAPGDAIIKVGVAALCGSDLHWYRGHMDIPTGFIPGHEFTGAIHELGTEVGGFSVGDAVVATFSTQCGECFYCQKGQTSRCGKGYLFGNSAGTMSIDGGQAEYVRVPQATSTLFLRPPSIPESLLVLMGDIFPTGYFAASRFLKHLPAAEAKSTVVAVVGCGPVGICAVAAALTWADTVFAIDPVAERVAEAGRIGAIPLTLGDDTAARIREATGGRGADVALEVVGMPDAMRLCIDMVRPFGHVSSVGVQTADLTLHGPTLYSKNITIAWGRCPVRGVFTDALACLEQVQDKVAFLCETRMSLDDAVEAYRLFNDRKVHKVLLTP
ncbi:chaperonin 10-like protein [Plectosphaerella plurivora]|uniref:Chaperonin 10-like protein n=1 Tax=Plectosphaerella plurivora TaxID=936078 RepID=A0A9P9A7H8_9PEZI|nr:chaperonin 10-like protein [Plectosphaerella plurivora]